MEISIPLEVGARPEDSQLAFRAQLPGPMGSGEGQSLAGRAPGTEKYRDLGELELPCWLLGLAEAKPFLTNPFS